MVRIEVKNILVLRNSTMIDRRLTVVLTAGVHFLDLEQTISGRNKACRPDLLDDGGVLDFQGTRRDLSRIGEAALLGDFDEVIPVQRAAQAFADEHRVLPQIVIETPVGVDVGEIHLTA